MKYAARFWFALVSGLVICQIGSAIACSPIVHPDREFVVYFSSGSAEISPLGISYVEDLFDEYRYSFGGNAVVVICGHSDTLGSDEQSMAISKRRAESVRDELVGLGLDPSLVLLCWKGEHDLAVQTPNETPEPSNRRVDIRIL